MTNAESVQARRYLLGAMSEDEAAVLEREYLERDDAIDCIAAAEDDLIEEYLSGQLTPADRDRFERSYLAAAQHRVRVETVRRLMADASHQSAGANAQTTRVTAARRMMSYGSWLALAASLIVAVSVAQWMFSPLGRRQTDVVEPPAAPSQPQSQSPATADAPRIFAEALSPVGVRGAAESPSLVIPAGTAAVVLRLESDADRRQLSARRVAIRTVGGQEVWQGAVTPETNPPPGTAARVDVPAARLPADDYLVTLYGTDRTGAEVEWAQYFLRVRAR